MLSGEAGREDMPMCEDANGGGRARSTTTDLVSRYAGRGFMR
jgi:hypothetical protein